MKTQFWRLVHFIIKVLLTATLDLGSGRAEGEESLEANDNHASVKSIGSSVCGESFRSASPYTQGAKITFRS